MKFTDMKWGKEFQALSQDEKNRQAEAMKPFLKYLCLGVILLIVLASLFGPKSSYQICVDQGLSAETCRGIEHSVYLDNKRELNDKIYGTPEMRAEDALRKAEEDAYTHEKQQSPR